MDFSNLNRRLIIDQLKSQLFDVLIIGGGITGAGIALDAASRGMKTALVEMQDFSSGTSSRSTKLVHGGLRYLKQLEVKMVAEVGRERAIVYENGPHVTTPIWMLLPLYKGGTFGKFGTSFGIRIYDLLAGVKKSERRKMLSREGTLKRVPLLKQDGLIGSSYYVEYRTDDARLTIEVMKAAFGYGALPLNYSKVESLIYENGTVIGAKIKDQLTGEVYDIFAQEVINATGPWVDKIREIDHSKNGKYLKLSKGAHIVINQKRFPLKQAVYFDTPDGRMVFAIPRSSKVYVGTTDTFFDEDPQNVTITVSDRDYIIDAINYIFPQVQLTEKDIESSWAGVRPLIFEEGKNPSEISRKDEIWESDSGLLTIAGGKLTGYRKMAEIIVDRIAVKLKKKTKKIYSRCLTKHISISGGDVGGAAQFNGYVNEQIKIGKKLGLQREEAAHLARIYGSNVPKVFELLPKGKTISEEYNIPLTIALKLLYAIQFEMIATPTDYFFRRTGELLFDLQTVVLYKDQVTKIMTEIFFWDMKHIYEYSTFLDREIRNATQ